MKMIFPILIVALSFFSCEMMNIGSGLMESEIREVDTFHTIHLGGQANIEIVQSDIPYLEVETDDNLIDDLKTEVRDGELYIYFPQGSYNPSRVNIDLSMADIREIVIDGEGNVETSGDINVESMICTINGVGNFDLNGSAQYLDLDINGVGDFMGEDFSVERADVDIEGIGNCSIDCSVQLNVDIDGVGDVRYTGTADVDSEIEGLGNVTKE